MQLFIACVCVVALSFSLHKARSYPAGIPLDENVKTFNLSAVTKEMILRRLSSPFDTALQGQAKSIVATYLLSLGMQQVSKNNLTVTTVAGTDPKTAVKVEGLNEAAGSTAKSVTALATTTKTAAITTEVPKRILSASEEATNNIEDIINAAIFASLWEEEQETTTVKKAVETTLQPVTGVIFGTKVDAAKPVLSEEEVQKEIISQVNRLIQNVGTVNVSGIVDESLNIASQPQVEMLINGIFNLVLCTAFDQLVGRCGPRDQ